MSSYIVMWFLGAITAIYSCSFLNEPLPRGNWMGMVGWLIVSIGYVLVMAGEDK
jgi:hypothetical protein